MHACMRSKISSRLRQAINNGFLSYLSIFLSPSTALFSLDPHCCCELGGVGSAPSDAALGLEQFFTRLSHGADALTAGDEQFFTLCI